MSATDEIPSDFDYSLLMSDLPELPEPMFEDELEALTAVAEEHRVEMNRKRVVIQHRLWDPKPVFRSSSLPPESPTPKQNTRRNQRESETMPTRQPPPMQPPSSPPVPLSQSSMEEEEITPTRQPPPPMQPPSSPPPSSSSMEEEETAPRPRQFVPNFALPLSGGGLFSKKITVSKRTEEKSTTKALSQEKTPPPPRLPRLPKPLSAITPQSTLKAPHTPQEVTIIASSGETFQVRRKSTASRDDDDGDDAPATAPARHNYYGIDIHGLLDEYYDNRAATRTPPPPPPTTTSLSPAQPQKKRQLWTEKYRARKFTDLVGDERTHRDVLRWLKAWDPIVFPAQQKKKRKAVATDEVEPEHRKILLLHGPPGLGKTTLAHVAARQAGYEPAEINASDDRSGGVVKGKIKDMLTIECVKSSGLTSGRKNQPNAGRPVCLVIDEIDGVTGGGGGNEAGFIKALIDLILADQRTVAELPTAKRRRKKKEEQFRLLRPIIAVCNDLYAPALKPLRQHAEVVQMRAPPMGLLVERLEWIFEKEGYTAEDGAVRRIVELSSMAGSSTRKGDMRGSLVNCEWIAAKLKQGGSGSGGRGKGGRLTRKAVEDELVGSRIGESDGKGSSGGRMAMRDALDAVFHTQKEPPARRGTKNSVKKTPAAKVQELIEAIGEFDRLTMDCFATYPTKAFNDDSILTKPNTVYEWLWFADLMSARVHSESASASYMSYPILAFHHLFSSPPSPSAVHERSDGPATPFSGLDASWEAHEALKEHTSMLAAIHSSIATARLSQTFKNTAAIVTELAPIATRILAPRINPVTINGAASVRRDPEKRLVARAVDAMEALGVRFEKVKVEGAVVGWAYRMDPPLDAVGIFSTLEGQGGEQVRFAVRQVVELEWKRRQIVKEKAVREARMGAVSLVAPSVLERKKKVVVVGKVKRDFFGRVLEEDGGDGDGGARKRQKLRAAAAGKRDVWVTYNEGFSNAVRKGIGLDELMEGLI